MSRDFCGPSMDLEQVGSVTIFLSSSDALILGPSLSIPGVAVDVDASLVRPIPCQAPRPKRIHLSRAKRSISCSSLWQKNHDKKTTNDGQHTFAHVFIGWVKNHPRE